MKLKEILLLAIICVLSVGTFLLSCNPFTGNVKEADGGDIGYVSVVTE